MDAKHDKRCDCFHCDLEKVRRVERIRLLHDIVEHMKAANVGGWQQYQSELDGLMGWQGA